jgi:hypothetical protein
VVKMVLLDTRLSLSIYQNTYCTTKLNRTLKMYRYVFYRTLTYRSQDISKVQYSTPDSVRYCPLPRISTMVRSLKSRPPSFGGAIKEKALHPPISSGQSKRLRNDDPPYDRRLPLTFLSFFKWNSCFLSSSNCTQNAEMPTPECPRIHYLG